MTVPKAIALSALPACLPAEQVNVLASGTRFCLKHILSGSHASPEGFWYDQPDDEWALLLAGSAVLEFEAGVVEMSAGGGSAHPRPCEASSRALSAGGVAGAAFSVGAI